MSEADANQIIEVLYLLGHVLAFGFGMLGGMHR
jgi:hypothetical protein